MLIAKNDIVTNEQALISPVKKKLNQEKGELLQLRSQRSFLERELA